MQYELVSLLNGETINTFDGVASISYNVPGLLILHGTDDKTVAVITVSSSYYLCKRID